MLVIMFNKTTVILLLLPLLSSIFLFPSGVQAQEPTLTIMSTSGQAAIMELKATQSEGGEVVTQASGFSLDSENVVSVPANGYVRVFELNTADSEQPTLTFTGAKLTPATTLETVDIPIQQGIISFVGIPAGVYTLDVIVDDQFAYECIVVVGHTLQQVQQIVNTQITEVNSNFNSNTRTEIVKVFEPGEDESELDREEVCRFTPNHPICAPDEDGECGEGFNMNEDGQCFPDEPCPSGFHRANDDETGACISEEDLEQCPDGSWQHPGDTCMGELPPFPAISPGEEDVQAGLNETATPTPTPSPTQEPQCGPGFVLENGSCAALDSICGGVPCTASEKEDSTTSDPVPGTSEPEPEPTTEPEPEPEPTGPVSEEETEEAETESSDDESSEE
jgi:hypothetical protein